MRTKLSFSSVSQATPLDNGYTSGPLAGPITVSKLSKLQKFILIELYPHWISRPTLILKFFGLLHTVPGLEGGKPIELIFGRSDDPKYNSATASISRALRRLKERGLIEIHGVFYGGGKNSWKQICLTDSGREVAEKLAQAQPIQEAA